MVRRRPGACLLRVGGDGVAVEGDAAAVGRGQPEAEAQGRRLAGPIWPEQAEAAARLDGKREVGDHRGAGIALAQFAGV